MPVLWTSQVEEWRPVPVPAPAAGLSFDGLCGGDHAPARLMLGRPNWVLLSFAGAPVFVNGERLSLGIRVLRDRDEISLVEDSDCLEMRRFYFSMEQLARIEPFPGSEKPTVCPRCKQQVEPGQPAVRCPSSSCGLWHHEDVANGLNCWSFAQHCALCDQPTALETGYRWTPDSL